MNIRRLSHFNCGKTYSINQISISSPPTGPVPNGTLHVHLRSYGLTMATTCACPLSQRDRMVFHSSFQCSDGCSRAPPLRPLCTLDPHFCRARTGANSATNFYPTVKAASRHKSADSEEDREDLWCHLGQGHTSILQSDWFVGQNGRFSIMIGQIACQSNSQWRVNYEIVAICLDLYFFSCNYKILSHIYEKVTTVRNGLNWYWRDMTHIYIYIYIFAIMRYKDK